jgi:hypothetical protein
VRSGDTCVGSSITDYYYVDRIASATTLVLLYTIGLLHPGVRLAYKIPFVLPYFLRRIQGLLSYPTLAVYLHTHVFFLTTMGAGAFIEPLVVVTLLFGGTWVNRNTEYRLFNHHRVYAHSPRSSSPSSSIDSGCSSPSSSVSLLSQIDEEPKWRTRNIQIMGMRKEITSPNTRRFQDYFLSRLLKKFPFLVEAWYWALIYWVRSTPLLKSYICPLTLQ